MTDVAGALYSTSSSKRVRDEETINLKRLRLEKKPGSGRTKNQSTGNPDKIKVNLKQWRKDEITIAISSKTTVGGLKEKIAALVGVHANQQALSFRGNVLKEDDGLLTDFLRPGESSLGLVLNQRDGENESEEILVKTPTGKKITIPITAKTTVAELKKKICDLEDVPRDQQRLIFAGRKLEDAKYLSSYGVDRKCPLQLVLKKIGGKFLVKLPKLSPEGKQNYGVGVDLEDPQENWMGMNIGLNVEGKCINYFCTSQWYKGSKRKPISNQGFGVFRFSTRKPWLKCPACSKRTLRPLSFLIAGAVSTFKYVMLRKGDEKVIKKVVLQSPGEYPKFVVRREKEGQVGYNFIEVKTEPMKESSEVV